MPGELEIWRFRDLVDDPRADAAPVWLHLACPL